MRQQKLFRHKCKKRVNDANALENVFRCVHYFMENLYPWFWRKTHTPLVISFCFDQISPIFALFRFSLAVQNVNQCQRALSQVGDGGPEATKGLLLLHHYHCINNTRFRSPCLRLVPRWSIRATWHRHEGGSWLGAAYERGAEQLRQSLTITVSGWGNGTVGRRQARMMLSSSWYHRIKLVMTEVTKQHSVCSMKKKKRFDCFKWVYLFFQCTEIIPVVTWVTLSGFFSPLPSFINIFCCAICSAIRSVIWHMSPFGFFCFFFWKR